MRARARVCVCVCVCVREREREREIVCSTEGRTWSEAAEGSKRVEGGGSRKLHNELRPSNVIREGRNVKGNFVRSECLYEWKSAAELLIFKYRPSESSVRRIFHLDLHCGYRERFQESRSTCYVGP